MVKQDRAQPEPWRGLRTLGRGEKASNLANAGNGGESYVHGTISHLAFKGPPETSLCVVRGLLAISICFYFAACWT